MEIWKDILTHIGIYQVSSLGCVKRLKVISTGRNQVTSWEQKHPEMIMELNLNVSGYPQVRLTIGGVRTARVHRLIAESFLEPPSDFLLEEAKVSGVDYVAVNHINGIRTDNRVENLEWCTQSYNLKDSFVRGTREQKKGEESVLSVLTNKEVLEIVKLLKNKTLSQESIGELFGVKQITVSNIWTGRNWSELTGIPKKKAVQRKKRKQLNESILRETH
jgi:hypothetical protein